MTESVTHSTEDLAAVQAERDALRARLEEQEQQAPRTHRTRNAAAAVLVVVACLAFLAAMPGLWASRNLLDTERFAARVGPLVADPDVQEVLTTRITDQVMLLVDPARLFEEALPERGDLLAVPLANAVEGFVRDRVADVVASDAFEQLWVRAVTAAHRAAVRVLEGESDVVLAEDGQVTLNLIPAIDAVLQRITASSPEVLGRQIDLPDVSVDEIPRSAIDRIEGAFDVELGDDYGQLTIYDEGKLRAAQQALDTFDRLVVVLLPLAVLAALGALWASTRRRRTLMQLAVGAALASVVVRRLVFALEDELSALPPTEAGCGAVGAISDSFLAPLTTFAAWTIGIATAVAVVGFLTGSSRLAVTVRSRSTSDSTRAWLHQHRELLVIGCIAVGVAALWSFDLSWLGVLVVVVTIGVLVAIVASPHPGDASEPLGSDSRR